MLNYKIFKLIENLYFIKFYDNNQTYTFEVLVRTDNPNHFAKLYRSAFSTYEDLVKYSIFYIFYERKLVRMIAGKEEGILRTFDKSGLLNLCENDTDFLNFVLFHSYILTDISKIEEFLNINFKEVNNDSCDIDR
jgi:hypothetical protein